MNSIEYRAVEHNDRALKDFSCGDAEVDKELKRQLKYVKARMIRLHGLYVNRILVGLITLEVGIMKAPSQILFGFSGTGKEVPTLYIKVLAIRKNRHRRGFGKLLIEYAIAVGLEMSKKVGMLTISLDATPQSIPLYKDVGFDQANSAWDDGSLAMWFVFK